MRRRLCAECGAELAPEGMTAPGATPCAQCGAQHWPVVEAEAVPMVQPHQGPPREEEVFTSADGQTTYRRVQQGPFVFQQYTRNVTGTGPNWGCGCGCLVIFFMLYLMARGFMSLFG